MADHYGRYDLQAFHLLVQPMSVAQLRGEEPLVPSPPSPEAVPNLVAELFSMLDLDQDGLLSAKDLGPAAGLRIEGGGAPERVEVFAKRQNEARQVEKRWFFCREAWPLHFRKLCRHWNFDPRGARRGPQDHDRLSKWTLKQLESSLSNGGSQNWWPELPKISDLHRFRSTARMSTQASISQASRGS